MKKKSVEIYDRLRAPFGPLLEPGEYDHDIWTQEHDGTWTHMCGDNTHPQSLICMKEHGHSGKHVAEFSGTSNREEW